jgi:hypothetical protein
LTRLLRRLAVADPPQLGQQNPSGPARALQNCRTPRLDAEVLEVLEQRDPLLELNPIHGCCFQHYLVTDF